MDEQPRDDEQTNPASSHQDRKSQTMGALESGQQTEIRGASDDEGKGKQTVAEPPRWKRLTGPDWVTAIATAMIFLATAAYVWYARKQWKVLSGQLTVVRNQLAETKASRRPWIGVGRQIQAQDIAIGPDKIEFRSAPPVKNFGPSPAFNVTAPFVAVAPRPEDVYKIAELSCQAAGDFLEGKMVPEIFKTQVAGVTLFPSEEWFPTFHVASPTIEPTATRIYLVGCIAYRDEFGKPHHTRFCEESQGTASILSEIPTLRPCLVYNDAD